MTEVIEELRKQPEAITDVHEGRPTSPQARSPGYLIEIPASR
jgi:hypothetical protein